MKKNLIRKILTSEIILLLIFNIIFISSAQTFADSNLLKDKKSVYKKLNILPTNSKLIKTPNNSEKIEEFFDNNNLNEVIFINNKESSNKTHPTFDRTNTGIHMAAFRDEISKEIIWTYSNNDGKSYEKGFQSWIGGDYPIIKNWDKKIFCGTIVSDQNDPHGGNWIYFFRCEDPKNIDSYMIFQIDTGFPGAPPFGKMTDAAIACDNPINNSYYWGAASYTINVGSYNNVPLLFYPEIPSNYLFGMSYYNIENCNHTDIDIDKITHKIYAVYDCYDSIDNSWKLYSRVKDFLDLKNGYDTFFEVQGSEDLQYPVIAANNNTIIILAETIENGNIDIVCLRSVNGLNNIQKTYLTISEDDERFPKIEYVNNDTYFCTFIKDKKLYKMFTENGGLTWNNPIVIDTDVISEYKSVTISDSAQQVFYEKNIGENIDLLISPLRNYTNNPDLQIPSISGKDKIDVSLFNNGGSDEANINWWINISGAIDQTWKGIIPLLKAGDTSIITVDNFYGSGDINLQAVFEVTNRHRINRDIIGYLNKNYIENIKFLWNTSEILYVDDDAEIGGLGTIDNPFISIDNALWVSSCGDTIFVREGNYGSWGLGIRILKSVRMLGEDKNKTSIISDFVSLESCGIVYSGFSHVGTHLYLMGLYDQAINNMIIGATIFIYGFSNNVINNNINGYKWGIVFESSYGYHIINQNIIENCSEGGIYYRGGSPQNIIDNNKFINNKIAINALTSTISNNFINNIIKGNNYGITLINSYNNIVKSNSFENNIYGIYLEDSSANRITNNNFILNDNSATFHHYSTIKSNIWFNNYWDDKGLYPVKIIFGKITIYYGYYNSFTIKWINVDFFPAKKPYGI